MKGKTRAINEVVSTNFQSKRLEAVVAAAKADFVSVPEAVEAF